ncbi:probable 28S ribosomal protein S26, mitochondrial [Galendromus occidentalis]|uniref:Small ribosomal subunit protein mS26 n=1 Tax=Galendromus occidentalis TaxID=34638 RepID=A0AAJ6VXB6_9ACAR|nr:probable 28S ribosomal protein S26, mitochondrial [Galendromus occidentalis]
MLRTLCHIERFLQKEAVLARTQVRLFRSDLPRFRKPRWMPRAPSKLFELPKHPVISEEEKLQYEALVKNYDAEIRAIQNFFRDEQARTEAEKGKFSETTIHEEEIFEAQLKAVEQENMEIAERRKIEHEKAFHERMALLLEEKRVAEENEQRRIEEARQLLSKEMENFKNITLETLDEAIERALDNQSTYDFALSATGEILRPKSEKRAG